MPRFIVFLTILVLAASCSSVSPCPLRGENEQLAVVSIGWHTGIALSRRTIDPILLPEVADFPDARFVEFGWGEQEYYMSERPSIWRGLADLLGASRSVMQITPIRIPLEEYFQGASLVFLPAGGNQLDELQRFIAESLMRGDRHRAEVLGTGHYPGSFFYPAKGRFSAFNTCNTWIARGLRAAGYPLSRPLPVTAGSLLSRLAEFGCVFEGKLARPRE